MHGTKKQISRPGREGVHERREVCEPRLLCKAAKEHRTRGRIVSVTHVEAHHDKVSALLEQQPHPMDHD